GRWIRVSTRRARHGGRPVVEVAVEDRGPGIHDEERQTVFEPFYRGASARRSRQPGSGLGLTIVRRAVEAYGGLDSPRRTVPPGCTFRMGFPTTDAWPQPVPA